MRLSGERRRRSAPEVAAVAKRLCGRQAVHIHTGEEQEGALVDAAWACVRGARNFFEHGDTYGVFGDGAAAAADCVSLLGGLFHGKNREEHIAAGAAAIESSSIVCEARGAWRGASERRWRRTTAVDLHWILRLVDTNSAAAGAAPLATPTRFVSR